MAEKNSERLRLSDEKKELCKKNNTLKDLINSKIFSLVTLGGAKEIGNLLEMTNALFNKDFNIEKTFEKPVAFTLKDFQEPQHFLHQIYVRLVKGEKMYSMHLYENKMKYGSIILHYEHKNKIFVHSLSLDEVDVEGAAYLLFSDIKKCATADNYETFLKFCPMSHDKDDYYMRIKMICNNQLTKIRNGQSNVSQRFVNLCTAETGHSLERLFGRFVDVVTRDGINVPAEITTASEDTTWPMAIAFKEDVRLAFEEDTLVIYKDCDQSSRVFCSVNEDMEDIKPSLMSLIDNHPENIIGFLQECIPFCSINIYLDSGITFKI